MESATRVQILDDDVCLSLHTNAAWKCIDPCSPYSLQYGGLVSLSLIEQTISEKKNSEFKPILLLIKIELVSSIEQNRYDRCLEETAFHFIGQV